MYSRNWHKFPMKGVWTSPVLKGRTMPFYALLRMSTETRVVPEWETYANSCVKKGTAKLILSEIALQFPISYTIILWMAMTKRSSAGYRFQ